MMYSGDVEVHITRLSFCQEPFCYPREPQEVITRYLPQTDDDIDLYFEALRRALAAHCRCYNRHLWRQLIICAAALFLMEKEQEELQEVEE